MPYAESYANHPQNGLLLRADLHTLFDLGELWIDADSMTVGISEKLVGTAYDQFQGTDLHLPNDPAMQPSRAALERHRRAAIGG